MSRSWAHVKRVEEKNQDVLNALNLETFNIHSKRDVARKNIDEVQKIRVARREMSTFMIISNIKNIHVLRKRHCKTIVWSIDKTTIKRVRDIIRSIQAKDDELKSKVLFVLKSLKEILMNSNLSYIEILVARETFATKRAWKKLFRLALKLLVVIKYSRQNSISLTRIFALNCTSIQRLSHIHDTLKYILERLRDDNTWISKKFLWREVNC